ncbi:DUF6766 family protein [Nocardioides speluncae]|uniref:DUF6766 family protein n=1 Tax=Nocardioides speluncae TaxID=2670337 RepID=UPI000D688127|nr:DUF6766 family protein [Nocardioides speluncae]
MRVLRNNGLLLVTLGLFAVFLVGLLLTGHAEQNAELAEHGERSANLWAYAVSADFGQAVFENWESEFLQMGMYVVLTAYLLQKGSAESRPPDGGIDSDEPPEAHQTDQGVPWPVCRGGVALTLYKNSLAILFTLLFGASMWLHAVSGAAKYSDDQLQHGGEAVSAWSYLGTSEFWFESFQNWQSEFLAVAVLVAATIWLRQQRSPQSKPVHAPHSQTGV